MKKSILSKIALHVLMLAGFILFASAGVSAQSNLTSVNDPTSFDEPKGPFVESSLALQLIDEESTNLKLQLEIFQPGTASYNLADWKRVYFNAVQNHIVGGRTVGQAIIMGFDIYHSAPYNTVPESQRIANKTAIINLLKI